MNVIARPRLASRLKRELSCLSKQRNVTLSQTKTQMSVVEEKKKVASRAVIVKNAKEMRVGMNCIRLKWKERHGTNGTSTLM